MPMDPDASTDVAAAQRTPPQDIFDATLLHLAQQLIDVGAVVDVRVLQNGRVVTGFAGDRRRVYIQYRRTGTATTVDGECSCAAPSPCMHVAAVAMTAAKFSGAPESRRVGIDLAAWWTVCRRYGP